MLYVYLASYRSGRFECSQDALSKCMRVVAMTEMVKDQW